MSEASLPVSAADERRVGLMAGAFAYSFWGFLPLYLKIVGFAGPIEILGWRILWCIPAALAAVAFVGGLSQLRAALQPRMLATLALSALFIFGNWVIFVWAVATNHVVEAALAYFLAPLVNVVFGVAFFGERMSRLQTGALALAAFGVVVQGIALGAPPYMALFLCITWSLYGLVRKQAAVASSAGLFVETVWCAPLALAALWWASGHGGLAFAQSPQNGVMLALLGPITAAPLIFFAIGARRLPFSTLGLLQYIGPTITFMIGVLYGEPFTMLRAVSFALIWGGLILYSVDMFRRERAPA